MTIRELYICEKPSQARDIAKILGCNERQNGYLKKGDIVVTWCFGHLLETASPDHYCENIKPWCLDVLPIVPDVWKMIIKKDGKQQAGVIKNLLKEAETVVISTDADREGEVIARELLDMFKFKGNIKRLWLSALDDASIKKALQSIKNGSETENLYYAGLGRQRADWSFGINMTRAVSVAYGGSGEGVLSVGRVQTPTLKLVVDRDRMIEQFSSNKYFELVANFESDKNEIVSAKWQPNENSVDEEGRILDKNIINAVIKKIQGKSAKVDKFDDIEKKTAPPLCLSLSQLQKLASSQFSLSAKETLDIAQSLYETHKAITYPRTDCGYLPESQLSEAETILSQLKSIPVYKDIIDHCDMSYCSPAWNDKKVTAHHAMIPTQNRQVDLNKMSNNEQKIYGLICRYYMAQFLGPYEYAERSIVINCHSEIFKASSQTPLMPGWKRALAKTEEKIAEGEEDCSPIPALITGDLVKEKEEKILEKMTRPPAYFTEGTLIDAMKSIARFVQDKKYKSILKETAGIGTEATRASIIETLFKRGYVEKKGKQVHSTEKGKKLILQLPPIICDPVLTAEWEQALDQVSEGQLSLDQFSDQQNQWIHQMLDPIKKEHASKAPQSIGHLCPRCKKSLVRRQSSKNKSYFWGCRGYPSCNFTASDQNNMPILVN